MKTPTHPEVTGGNTNSRHRAFCFTSFSEDKPVEPHDAKYFAYELEKCPETGNMHYQGYVYFNNSKTISAAAKSLKKCCHGKQPHVEVARGTPMENRAYCGKEGGLVETGKMPLQGERTDLQTIIEDISSGNWNEEDAIVKYGPWIVRYYRGINYVRERLQADRDWTMEVIVIIGAPGIGKTRLAVLEANKNGNYFMKDNSKWWDGYNHEYTVIWDDFDEGRVQYKDLLRILDRYKLTVEIKGGYMRFNSKRIIITSTVHPSQWYESTHAFFDYRQLARRITKVIEMKIESE